MLLAKKQASLLVISLLLGNLMAACAESKVSQCNKMIAVVNKGVTELRGMAPKGKNTDPQAQLTALSEMATKMEGYATELQGLKLSDEKLKTFQTNFITLYRDTSKASRDMVSAVKSNDTKAINTSLQSLQKATAPESKLVNDTNQYCQGK